MDVVRPFIGVDRFQVDRVAHHMEFGRNAVAAMHVAGDAGDVERLAAIVALDDADRVGRQRALVEHPPRAQRDLQPQRDFGRHIGQLELHQLRRRQRAAELRTIERILARGTHTGLRRAHHAPGDAITRAVEAAERPLQPLNIGQQRILAHLDILHHDFAGDARAQRQLALDLGRRQPLKAAFEDEAANAAAMRVAFRPHHHDVGDRRVGDPHLAAVQPITAVDLGRTGAHAAGIAARIRLGQAETADPFAAGQFGQIFAALFLAAIGKDGVHHQARLDAHRAAIARIDRLDLARHQAIGDIAQACAAIVFRNRRPQHAERAEFGHDFPIEPFVEKGRADPRQQPLLRIGVRGVADHALLIGQLRVERERVLPVEPAHIGHCLLSL